MLIRYVISKTCSSDVDMDVGECFDRLCGGQKVSHTI